MIPLRALWNAVSRASGEMFGWGMELRGVSAIVGSSVFVVTVSSGDAGEGSFGSLGSSRSIIGLPASVHSMISCRSSCSSVRFSSCFGIRPRSFMLSGRNWWMLVAARPAM